MAVIAVLLLVLYILYVVAGAVIMGHLRDHRLDAPEQDRQTRSSHLGERAA